MAIDEVIEELKSENGYYANNGMIDVAEFNTEIIRWLEELKELRETSCGYSKEDIELNRNAMYNKAIDDFVRFANDMPTVEEEDGTIRPMWLEEIAEQLKAGGENDKSI